MQIAVSTLRYSRAETTDQVIYTVAGEGVNRFV
jgi:hypothetical protein